MTSGVSLALRMFCNKFIYYYTLLDERLIYVPLKILRILYYPYNYYFVCKDCFILPKLFQNSTSEFLFSKTQMIKMQMILAAKKLIALFKKIIADRIMRLSEKV